MILNRWTILAVILLLSTGVGLLSRPWGASGFEGRQVVEHQGLSLECPETITGAAGSTIEFYCEVNNNSRFQHYSHTSIDRSRDGYYDYQTVGGNFQDEKIGFNRYLVRKLVWVYRNGHIPVTAIVRPELGFLGGTSVTNNIEVEVRRPLFYYTGLGLFFLQIVALVALAIVKTLVVVDRTGVTRGSKVGSLFAVNEYRAVDTLWMSYIVQALLMLVYHIWEIQTITAVDKWTQLPPQVLYILTLPFALVGIALLLATWICTMKTTKLSNIWADSSMSHERGIEQLVVNRTWIPFAGVVVVGCLLAPLTYWLYLVLEL